MELLARVVSLSFSKLLCCVFYLSTSYCFAEGVIKPAEAAQQKTVGSIVQVLAYKGDTLINQGSGVVIASGGIVLTSTHLLESSDKVVIQKDKGVKNNAVVVFKADSNDVAVLRSSNLGVSPIDISLHSVSQDDAIEIIGYWKLSLEESRGSFFDFSSRPKFIAQVVAKKQFAKALLNNPKEGADSFKVVTSIGRGGYGAPLVNRCGQLLGIVRPDVGKTLKQLWQPHVPSGAVVTDLNVLIKTLEKLNIISNTASKPCLSVLEQQKLVQSKKQAEVDRAKKKIKQAKKETSKAIKQAEVEKEAREEAEKKNSDIKSVVTDINAKAEELDIENAEAKKENETLFWVGIVAIAAAVLIIFILFFKRKRDLLSAKMDLEAASAAFGDCKFEGVDSSGAPVAFIVLGKDLMQRKSGLIIGRNPDVSQVVIADDTVSREHARLHVEGKHLCIVDLDSTGGTQVNGQLIGVESEVIISGDNIQIGDVRVNIIISGVE